MTEEIKQSTEKSRLPSLYIGNLPANYYDLDLFKLIEKQGIKPKFAKAVIDTKGLNGKRAT
jgi:RNA recognition motif-containing protein